MRYFLFLFLCCFCFIYLIWYSDIGIPTWYSNIGIEGIPICFCFCEGSAEGFCGVVIAEAFGHSKRCAVLLSLCGQKTKGAALEAIRFHLQVQSPQRNSAPHFENSYMQVQNTHIRPHPPCTCRSPTRPQSRARRCGSDHTPPHVHAFHNNYRSVRVLPLNAPLVRTLL